MKLVDGKWVPNPENEPTDIDSVNVFDQDRMEWDMDDTARRVKFIPAPEDDTDW